MVKVREFAIVDLKGNVNETLWLAKLKEHNYNIEFIENIFSVINTWIKSDPKTKGDKERLFVQGITMADILSDLNLDESTLIAAILFNPVHDLKFDLTKIPNLPKDILEIINGVQKMDAIRDLKIKNLDNQLHADKIRKMLLAMVEDVRVVVVRLAEHLYMMRQAIDAPKALRREIAKETLNIYAPLSNRLGIGQIKWELEDLAFRYLQPNEYKYIATMLDEKRIKREEYIEEVVNNLQQSLKNEGIEAEVIGRPKHIYSIWRKMQKKKLDYHEIYDLRAVRVLTQKISDCYGALGVVHALWQHIPKEFDDYIALPKDNGYQSLHTAVVGPQGKVVEIQIRTEKMHKDAELGIAAHWRYKEGVNHDANFENKITWLRQLLAWQEEIANTAEIIAEFKGDLAVDRVYVLTPNGDIFDFPEGATPLDFAYTVHTSVGHRCRGAKANGHMVPLTYKMVTGDQIEILTSNKESPSRDWLNVHLNFLKTPRARSKVQTWFKKQSYDDNANLGREVLTKELNRLGIHDFNFEKVLPKLNLKTVNDLFAVYGTGDIKLSQILGAADHIKRSSDKMENLPVVPTKIKKTRPSDSIIVEGLSSFLTNIARCCKPIPGERIIGFITQGRGVTVHKKDCQNILFLQDTSPDKTVGVSWAANSFAKSHAVEVNIVATDRPSILKDITTALATAKVNILALNTNVDQKTYLVKILLTFEITSLEELGKVLNILAAVPSVKEIKRVG